MPHFDLIRPIPRPLPPQPQKPRKKRRWWLLILVLLIPAVAMAYNYLSKTNEIFTNKGNIFARVGNLLISNDKPLQGEEEGQVNILLMGIGGEGHDGANLTDTMIVASINTETNEVTLVSIPRDFAVTLPKYGYNKINAAYAYAYRDDPDTAGDAAIVAAEMITGFEIPYFAVIDFRGFVEAVNHVGGLNIEIENTFTDSTFPNDYPYDTRGYLAPVTFTKGPEHMNGQRALIFARSRHSNNPLEGSDFARSERQKKILVAMKEKILDLNLGKLSTINNLLHDFTENFRTNMEPHELKRLAELGKDFGSENIYSYSMEPDGVLICSALVDPATGRPVPAAVPKPETEEDGGSADDETEAAEEPQIVRMYVVQPCRDKSLTDIKEFLGNYLDIARLQKEDVIVEIQNSTGRTYATTKYQDLGMKGVTAKFSTFKGRLPFEHTVLYDNSRGTKPKTLDYLKATYNPTISDVTYPTSNADFVIIIGRDAL